MPTHELDSTGPGPGWPGDPWSEPWPEPKPERKPLSEVMAEAMKLPECRRLLERGFAAKYPWANRIEVHGPDPCDFAPREDWGEGPWQHEPDLVEWRHESGLPLLMTRGPSGSWCGYVGLPPAHPGFGEHYDKVEESSAHGGLTFAGTCGGHICHVPEPGEHREVWWVGFDCAHAGDLAPGLRAITRRHSPTWRASRELMGEWEVYRDLDYVKQTVEELADELAGKTSGRERWFDPLLALCKLGLRRDLARFWREIYLEQDHYGRGPEERETMQAAYGGDRWDPNGLAKVAQARRRDRPWRRMNEW